MLRIVSLGLFTNGQFTLKNKQSSKLKVSEKQNNIEKDDDDDKTFI